MRSKAKAALPQPAAHPAEPAAPEVLDLFEHLTAPLDTRENRFVLGVLRGETHQQAAEGAGMFSELAPARYLGRPHVARALEQLAPLLCDRERSLAALAPLLLARQVAQATSGKAGSQAALRDLFAVQGEPQSAKDARAKWREAQERRKRATGGEPGPGSGPGPGAA